MSKPDLNTELSKLASGTETTFRCLLSNQANNKREVDMEMLIGKKVIVRSYLAGCYFGTLVAKAGKEVVLSSARMLLERFYLDGGVSVNKTAIDGLASDSKVCAPVDMIWLEATSIVVCSPKAIASIESQSEHNSEQKEG